MSFENRVQRMSDRIGQPSSPTQFKQQPHQYHTNPPVEVPPIALHPRTPISNIQSVSQSYRDYPSRNSHPSEVRYSHVAPVTPRMAPMHESSQLNPNHELLEGLIQRNQSHNNLLQQYSPRVLEDRNLSILPPVQHVINQPSGQLRLRPHLLRDGSDKPEMNIVGEYEDLNRFATHQTPMEMRSRNRQLGHSVTQQSHQSFQGVPDQQHTRAFNVPQNQFFQKRFRSINNPLLPNENYLKANQTSAFIPQSNEDTFARDMEIISRAADRVYQNNFDRMRVRRKNSATQASDEEFPIGKQRLSLNPSKLHKRSSKNVTLSTARQMSRYEKPESTMVNNQAHHAPITDRGHLKQIKTEPESDKISVYK